MSRRTVSKKRVISLFAVIVTMILFMQLYAVTAWTADDANAGATVAIVQLSNDPDSDWAVNDILTRLQEFIPDDPYINDRVVVIQTSDPYIIQHLQNDIVIYVSHGGPAGMVTGNHITSWKTMADIVSASDIPIHLFTTCHSKRIVKYGSSEADKILYTVPEARPAEVSDIEIISTVLLALGVDSSYVDTYRTQELTKAKEYIQSGGVVHIMDFNEVILETISNIQTSNPIPIVTYNPPNPLPPGIPPSIPPSYLPEIPDGSPCDYDQIVIRYESTYTYDLTDYNSLSECIRNIIENYYRAYTLFDGTSGNRIIENLMITCVEEYYSNATYWAYGESGTIQNLLDSYQLDPTLSTFYYYALQVTEFEWIYTDPELIGISYSGTIQLGGINTPYTNIELQIIANADGSGEIQSVFINQTCEGGLYVETTYTDGVASIATGRNAGRSQSYLIDSLNPTDYEYIEDWPGHPYTDGTNSAGELQSINDYLTIVSIPDAQGWHGPSFVKMLPSSFRLQDLTSFSVNISLYHGGNDDRATSTLVGLYDENQKPVLTLIVEDPFPGAGSDSSQKLHAIYYREDGTSIGYVSDVLYGDFIGVLSFSYDTIRGLSCEIPDEARVYLCNPYEISWDRIVKYLTIESCRYYDEPLHDARIYAIRVESTHSDYVTYHENCQSVSKFFSSDSLGWGTLSDGTIEVPSGESYIHVSDVPAFISGYSFRKSHNLNGVSGAGTNYQIQITVHYGSGTDGGQNVYLNSHSKIDFSDIRFVSSDETTLLDYWCESVVAGNYATFWVEIADSLEVDQTIYVYYGNSAATSASNGDATFLMYEDWSSQSTDAWTKWKDDSGGSATFESTGATHGYVYKINAGNGNYGDEFHSEAETDQPFSLMFRANIPSTASSYQYARVGAGWAGEYTLTYIDTYSSTTRRFQVYGDNGISTSQTMDTSHFGSFHTFQITRPRDGTTTKLYIDGALDETANLALDAQTVYYASFGVQDAEYYLYTDWFAARKYLSSEPTHGAWGAEVGESNLDDWSYIKAHTLNGVPGAGYDYQIPITAHYGSGTDAGQDVYLNSHSKTDFSDVRFTSSDGSTLLDYWCESVVVGSYAKFWVKISENLDYNQEIFIYYGNDVAESLSNGEATFLFFDDFNDGIIDAVKWNTHGTWDESGGTAMGTVISSGGNYNHPCLSSTQTFNIQDTSLESRLKYNSLTTNRQWGLNTLSDSSGHCSYILRVGGAHLDANGGGYEYVNNFYSTWSNSVWYNFEMSHTITGGTSNTFRVDSSSTSYNSIAVDTTQQRINLMFYVKNYYGYLQPGTTEMEFDWVFLRNKIANEPSHGAWGVEVGNPNLDDWSYRKSHTLNGVSGAGTDYQIQITAHYGSGTDAGQDVYLNSHSKTDFSDVRFTSSDGSRLLDYWCEPVAIGDNAVFWVEVKDDLSSNQEIVMYYGNPGAISASNGAATFIAFDDFEDYTPGATPSAENGWTSIDDVYIQNNPSGRSGMGLKLDTAISLNSEGVVNDWGASGYDSIAIHYMWYCSRVVDRNGYTSITGYAGTTPATPVTTLWNGVGTDSRDWYNGAYYAEYSPQFTYSSGIWYEIEEHVSNNYYHSMKNGVDLSAGVRTTGVDNFYSFAISTYQDNRHGDWFTQYDDFFVTKWVENEPTHGAWGEEEGLSGWHGPNYIQVLDRPFRLSQLSEFSIESEILCDLGEKGRVEVGLFDENKECILMFTFGGLGGSAISPGGTYTENLYYPQDAAVISQSSETYANSNSWNTKLWREDGLSGGVMFSEIDGQSIAQPWTIANDSRVIKYLAIIPSRYESTPIPEMRIHDIRVVAAIDPSQHAVAFIENCRDTDGNLDLDNFHSLPGFDYGVVRDGNLHLSSNGYLYPSIVESEAYDWQGPNYVHILERPFPLCNLTSFLATEEIVQSSYTTGKIDVALFDENNKIIMSIYSYDASYSSYTGYHHVAYYTESGSASYDTTGSISSSFVRTSRLWYEDGNIKYEIEGIESGDLCSVENPNRIIKYVVIKPQFNGESLVEMKIHGIVLTSDYRPADDTTFSEPGFGFIEDCKNVYNLPKDLSFGWGVITDGSLVTPSQADYIIPTSIPGASGWHGPNFVHVLDQPLRLYELSDFAVTGGIYQSPSIDSLGKMDVALFDENMQIVMNIYWGDSWYEHQTAYYHVQFYPESGGVRADTTGYEEDTSFVRTGRMWYDDGLIKYQIEGEADGDLGTVDNPYRLIKYVVIRPSKSGWFTMADLKLYQISVTSNFRTPTEDSVNFPAPEKTVLQGKYDASIEGQIEGDELDPEGGQNYVYGEWTFPWPVYHIFITVASLVIAHLTIDILLVFSIVQLGLFTWLFQALGYETEGYEYGLGILDSFTNWLIFVGAITAYQAMVASLMVFDYTANPYALLAGGLSGAACLILCHFAAQFFANECESPYLAGYLWATLLVNCIATIIGALKWLDKTVDAYRGIAKTIFGFLDNRLGIHVQWSGSHLKFRWATLVGIIIVAGVCIWQILAYAAY